MKRPIISSGPIGRTRHTERAYKHYRKHKEDKCDFCHFSADSPEVIAEYPLFWHVVNKFGYAVWDGCRVVEHSMIVPKRHVVSLSEFTPEEALEYFALTSEFEGDGNSLYSRSDKQVTKSVPHQHTHIIRLDGKKLKSLVYNHSPHILNYR
jgi:ATP adenylyltransferase